MRFVVCSPRLESKRHVSVTQPDGSSEQYPAAWLRTGSGRFLPGTKELEEVYMAIQLRLEAGSLRLLRCPTCQESCNGVRYQEWLQVPFMQHHQADMAAGRRRVM